MLTDQELKKIRQEAEAQAVKIYPTIPVEKGDYGTEQKYLKNKGKVKRQRNAYVAGFIAAVTKEREAHKKEVHELLEAIARGEDLNAKIRWDDMPISDYQMLKNELEKERERAGVLIDALKKIKDPIAAMRENLKEGEKLNGYEAIRLSNNADYLKEIASNTLKQYNQ